MQKFQFRLETVSKVRRIEMEQQAKVLALLAKDIALIKTQILEFKDLSRKETLRVQELAKRGNFSEQMMLLSLAYREGLKRKIIEKMREQQALERKAENEKAILIEKTKRKKVIEKLEEREKEAYEINARKQETKEMDEIAGILLDRRTE